jgi:hypothetical protein
VGDRTAVIGAPRCAVRVRIHPWPYVQTIGNIQSRTALRLIREWAVLHQAELQANWEQVTAGQPLNGIAPLE